MKQNNPMLEQREGNNEHPGGQENTSAFTQHGKILKLGKFQLEHWQIISLLLVIYDYCAVVGAYFLALWLRFDGIFSAIPQQYLSPYRSFVFLFALICIVIFAAFHMYNSMWRYASFAELERVLLASVIASVLHTIGITVIFTRMPIAYYLLGALIQFVLLLGIRFAYRFLQLIRARYHTNHEDDAIRVMLVGAGSAGQMILRKE